MVSLLRIAVCCCVYAHSTGLTLHTISFTVKGCRFLPPTYPISPKWFDPLHADIIYLLGVLSFRNIWKPKAIFCRIHCRNFTVIGRIKLFILNFPVFSQFYNKHVRSECNHVTVMLQKNNLNKRLCKVPIGKPTALDTPEVDCVRLVFNNDTIN